MRSDRLSSGHAAGTGTMRLTLTLAGEGVGVGVGEGAGTDDERCVRYNGRGGAKSRLRQLLLLQLASPTYQYIVIHTTAT